jgi:tRNA threonylcarbamoyladenosine biosynthesis protein TsaE
MTILPSSLFRQAGTDADMQTLGATLARAVSPGTVIYLYGPLGAGKTTFVRGFLRGLGFEDKVKSPTYTIVEPYEIAAFPVYHFDLYRLNQPEELQQIGLEEYFTALSVCLIEWPEKGQPLLPAPDIVCYIDTDQLEASRRIRLEACSASGEEILARL